MVVNLCRSPTTPVFQSDIFSVEFADFGVLLISAGFSLPKKKHTQTAFVFKGKYVYKREQIGFKLWF